MSQKSVNPIYIASEASDLLRLHFLTCLQRCRSGELYRGADKSLARPIRKQARKHALYFNNMETRAVMKFFFLQCKAPKEIHATLTEKLSCFLPGRTKHLSAPLYMKSIKLCVQMS